jgi:hypothetical protein
VKSWSCTSWFGQWSPDLSSSLVIAPMEPLLELEALNQPAHEVFAAGLGKNSTTFWPMPGSAPRSLVIVQALDDRVLERSGVGRALDLGLQGTGEIGGERQVGAGRQLADGERPGDGGA